MEFSISTAADLSSIQTQALAVGVFEQAVLSDAADQLDRACDGLLRKIVAAEFKAKPGSLLLIHRPQGVAAERIVLLGLGAEQPCSTSQLAKAQQALGAYCAQAGIEHVVSTIAAIACPQSQTIDRARLTARLAMEASYHYDETLSKPKDKPRLQDFVLHVTEDQARDARAGLAQGAAIGAGVNLARKLGDLPPNICTPAYLGQTAKDLAKQFSTLSAEVLDQKKIEALKMGSFLSVARGSATPPTFIILRHTPSQAATGKQAPIVLVGKGITFDSGGISIKPGAAMDEMKFDMCGAASVLGTLRAAAEMDLPREIIGLIPSCENLPSSTACKPGDIVTSMSGQTIEILNTDAEGRLILCDALTYAERFEPAAVIDIATLTGACVIALGHTNSGLFSTDDTLAESLLAAGRTARDSAWRMPLDDDYQELLKSNFADMANIGGRAAGVVTAACFLSRFTKKYSWAHLDIAGTAWLEGKKKGATGRPVPLLAQFLLDQTDA